MAYESLIKDVEKRGAAAVLQDLARQAAASGKEIKLPNGVRFNGDIFNNWRPESMGAGQLIARLAPHLPQIYSQLQPQSAPAKAAAPKQAGAVAPRRREDAVGAMLAMVESAAPKLAVQLPETMSLKDFVATVRDPAERERLVPGITGKTGYKSITTGPDGQLQVKIANRQIETSDPHIQAFVKQQPERDAQAAMQGMKDGTPPPLPMVRLGELVRQYGTDVVNTMYPGIFEPKGYEPYAKKYGMHPEGGLQVPDFRVSARTADPNAVPAVQQMAPAPAKAPAAPAPVPTMVASE